MKTKDESPRPCCPHCGRVMPRPPSPEAKEKLAKRVARETARLAALLQRASNAGLTVPVIGTVKGK